MFLGLIAFAFIVLVIVLWIMMAIKVAGQAKERGESYALYLLCGLCLSPATSALVLNLADSRREKSMKEQIEYLSHKYNADIRLLQAPLVEISSTTIRNRLKQGLSIRYMVPDTVSDYIRKNRLYTTDSDSIRKGGAIQ